MKFKITSLYRSDSTPHKTGAVDIVFVDNEVYSKFGKKNTSYNIDFAALGNADKFSPGFQIKYRIGYYYLLSVYPDLSGLIAIGKELKDYCPHYHILNNSKNKIYGYEISGIKNGKCRAIDTRFPIKNRSDRGKWLAHIKKQILTYCKTSKVIDADMVKAFLDDIENGTFRPRVEIEVSENARKADGTRPTPEWIIQTYFNNQSGDDSGGLPPWVILALVASAFVIAD